MVPSEADRVYRLHQNTLMALEELEELEELEKLVQAAGLAEPSQITAAHIVRRSTEQNVKLLANLLPFMAPGELLRGEMSQRMFRLYWPMAQVSRFSVAEPV